MGFNLKSATNKHPLPRPGNRIWLLILLITAVIPFLLAVSWCQPNRFWFCHHLLYIPLIIASIRFQWKGVIFSLAIILSYIVLIIFLKTDINFAEQTITIIPVQISIAAIMAWLSADVQKSKSLLRETIERYKMIADYTYNWEYWLDANRDLRYISGAVEKITGYTPEEFSKEPNLLDRIIHPLDHKHWLSHKCISYNLSPTKTETEDEFRIITKSGETRWIGHLCRKVYTSRGEYNGLRVSIRDITQQIMAEKKAVDLAIESEKKERNFYSREIHDRLGPLLSTIKLYFQWLAETDDMEKARMITEKGNQSIDAAIETMREISLNLSSQNLDKSGFFKALQFLAQQINQTQKLKIQLSFETEQRFEKTREDALYYIVAELINNTLKHASANIVDINYQLKKSEQIIKLTYRDDGIGVDLRKFVENKNLAKGLGLENIQQRIKALRGRFTIKTSEGNGFEASIELPL
jgi:PAS domain S-box-containing protein